MLLRVAFLFLIGMAIIAMIGKWKFPGVTRASLNRCENCGRVKSHSQPCNCRR